MSAGRGRQVTTGPQWNALRAPLELRPRPDPIHRPCPSARTPAVLHQAGQVGCLQVGCSPRPGRLEAQSTTPRWACPCNPCSHLHPFPEAEVQKRSTLSPGPEHGGGGAGPAGPSHPEEAPVQDAKVQGSAHPPLFQQGQQRPVALSPRYPCRWGPGDMEGATTLLVGTRRCGPGSTHPTWGMQPGGAGVATWPAGTL